MRSESTEYRICTAWGFIGKYHIIYYRNNNVVAYLDRVTLTQYYLEQGVHFKIDIAFTVRCSDYREWYLNNTVFKSLALKELDDL